MLEKMSFVRTTILKDAHGEARSDAEDACGEEASLRQACVGRYLDLATNHVTQTTMDWLSQGAAEGFTVAPYDYGCFVVVPADVERVEALECPDDLKDVMRYAIKRDCHLIRFDALADSSENLHVFEW